jgi:uncharacterized protein (DUF1697 family)
MAVNRYAALLRGINVGGRNPVPMVELREVFTTAGFTDVSTYIQSGNVLFSAARPGAGLEGHIEEVLEQRFGVPIVVVVRSLRQLRSVVGSAPPGFGERPEEYHSDAIFLKAPLTPAKAMKVVRLRDEVDQAWAGTGVLYFARLSERRTQSKLSRIMGTPEYQLMTIRSWSTTTRLLALLDGGAPPG